MSFAVIAAVLVPSAVALLLWQRQVALRREAHIRNFELPVGLFDRLRKHHPGLSQKDCQLVAHALRQFFLTHLKCGRRNVSMPSQVVDDLWHEFILYTKNYQAFCRRAFGRFLHHTPAVALGGGGARVANAGLRRCFWFACREEHINPKKPTRLPLLFAIDAKLAVPGGFHYVTDCATLRAQQGGGATAIYCGGDFADASVDGGIDGFGDGGDSSSHGSDGTTGSDNGGGGGSDSGCSGGGCGGSSGE